MQPIPNLHNWLEYLPEPVLEKVKSSMKSLKVADGQSIYSQHDHADCLYQIVTGRVRACNYSAKGKEIVYAIFNPNDCFGELGLIDSEPRHSHMFAFGDTKLNVLYKADFNRLYHQHIEIPQSLNRMLCKRLRFAFMATEDFSLLNLRERLARYLIGIAKQKTTTNEHPQWMVETTQEDLAKMLCTSRQSIGKELKYFESIQALAVSYGQIDILDMAKLNTLLAEL